MKCVLTVLCICMHVAVSISCQWMGLPVTITRQTRGKSKEESFDLCRLSDGSLVFTQPFLSNYRSYTRSLCLHSGLYQVRMSDSGGDGWSSGSTVSFSIGYSTFGPYSLSGYYYESAFFTIPDIPSYSDLYRVYYYDSTVNIQKGISFSISPKNHKNGIHYSVNNGHLLSGLSLDSSSGVISGTPTSTHVYSQIVIKAYSLTDVYIYITISFTVFENPTSCASDKVLVTINRITKYASDEESFRLYEGSSPSGTLSYVQPYIMNYRSYVWKTCLHPGSHTIKLLDSANNGWASGSTMTISIGSKTYSDRLSSGNSTVNTVLISSGSIFKVTDIGYSVTFFAIEKSISFSVSPNLNGNDFTYTVSSGSLPSGLLLNGSSGVISGTPSAVSSNNVTITIYSSSNSFSVTCNLTFAVFENPTSCPFGKVLLTINRVTKTSSSNESFRFYEGSGTSGQVVYTQPYIMDNRSYV